VPDEEPTKILSWGMCYPTHPLTSLETENGMDLEYQPERKSNKESTYPSVRGQAKTESKHDPGKVARDGNRLRD
jgi:hypothetical protein